MSRSGDIDGSAKPQAVACGFAVTDTPGCSLHPFAHRSGPPVVWFTRHGHHERPPPIPLPPRSATFRHYNLRKLRAATWWRGSPCRSSSCHRQWRTRWSRCAPPQYGIYTSVIQGVLGALLSSSEHLTTGPTNTQSLLIAATVTRIAGMTHEVGDAVYLQLVFTLTFLKGLIQLSFWTRGSAAWFSSSRDR